MCWWMREGKKGIIGGWTLLGVGWDSPFILNRLPLITLLRILRYVIDAGSNYNNGRWAVGDEPLYYVVSPKDIVIAKPR